MALVPQEVPVPLMSLKNELNRELFDNNIINPIDRLVSFIELDIIILYDDFLVELRDTVLITNSDKIPYSTII